MDNGDGSSSDENGDIWDNASGAWLGYENGNGTWTDANGQNYTADNRPIDAGGYADNGDGTFTSIYSGEVITGGGNMAAGPDGGYSLDDTSGLLDNGDGTFTNPTNGDLIYPNGDVEHDDGTWTFYDGTTYDPLLGADPTVDEVLTKAGAQPIGGPIGASKNASGQQSNSSVQSALASLANLLKQAQTSNNASQLAAIRTAQQRLGALPATSTLSSTAKIAIAGGALLALYAISQRRRVA